MIEFGVLNIETPPMQSDVRHAVHVVTARGGRPWLGRDGGDERNEKSRCEKKKKEGGNGGLQEHHLNLIRTASQRGVVTDGR